MSTQGDTAAVGAMSGAGRAVLQMIRHVRSKADRILASRLQNDNRGSAGVACSGKDNGLE